MIHFKTQLKDTAFELIKLKDNVDLANDLLKIDKHIIALREYPLDKSVLVSAQSLDNELHNKYPIIDVLLDLGCKMATVFGLPANQYYSESETLQSNLTQDTFGILCHALIKEKIIDSAESFIDHVD